MILVGLVGILLSLASYRVAFPQRVTGAARLFAACLIVHFAATLAYWQYTLHNPADSHLYYADTLNWSRLRFKLGTIFVLKTVQWVKQTFGGSYLDFFLLFQAFGMIGIALIIRSFQEISHDLRQPLTWPLALLLLLPGLHFWTSGIGKDGLLFLAVALSVWATIRIERRFPAFIAALMIMAPVRPHMAAIALIALLATLLFDLRIRMIFKVPMALVMVIGLAFVLQGMQQSLGIATLDPEAVSEFISSKQEYGLREGGIHNLPYPLRPLSLLFRPFFFDATGIMGLAASIENFVLLIVFGTLARFFPTLLALAARVAYVRYCLIFSIVLIALLSAVTYNVGLGLRQKYMAMPAILVLYVTLILYRRASRAAADPKDEETDPGRPLFAQLPR